MIVFAVASRMSNLRNGFLYFFTSIIEIINVYGALQETKFSENVDDFIGDFLAKFIKTIFK